MSETDLLVSAEVEWMTDGGELSEFQISNIPCKWVWKDISRTAAEYWAVFDHVGDNYKFNWFTIRSWSSSPVKDMNNKEKN